jgi:hypothetical protein
LVTMAPISSLLTVRVPLRSLNNRNAEGFILSLSGLLLGCGEERHQGAQLTARVEHARFHGVNRAVDDGAKAPPANIKKGCRPRDRPCI